MTGPDLSPRPPAVSFGSVPGAPPPGRVLCRLDDIECGASRVFEFFEGQARFEMFVHRTRDTVVAYVNRCPHAGTPLDWRPGVFLDATGSEFQCATHGARFRIADGLCVHGPCAGKWLTPVRIRIADGVLYTQ